MIAKDCIHNIIEHVTYLHQLENPIFQQYNESLPTAAVTTRFLRTSRVTVLPCPARSADLSPIAHVRGMIGGRLIQLPSLLMDMRYLRHEVQLEACINVRAGN